MAQGKPDREEPPFIRGEELHPTALFLSLARYHGIEPEVEALLDGRPKLDVDALPGLGEMLLTARRRAHLTIIQVFQRSGISRSQLSFYESGRQKNPGLRTIQALSYGYRIPFALLLTAALRDILPRYRPREDEDDTP